MHVVIIGNGVTGVTAALRLRRRRPDWRITLVSGESMHHFSRPALMYLFMGHMKYPDTKPFPDELWREQGIQLVRDWVTGGDLEAKRLVLHRGGELAFDKLLLATGSKPNRFGWPGQDLDGVQGLYGLPDLVKLHETVQRTRRAVIVGGGLIGVELAEMLLSRRIAVTMLVREASYWNNVLPPEESQFANDEVREHGVDLRLETGLQSIEDDGNGRCAAAITSHGERIECQLVGLTAGVAPNVELARALGLATARGILVDASLRTSHDDVFAAGDCAELVYGEERPNLVQQVWYTGKMQGEVVSDVLAGDERAYDPGIWFNSAKFFELEYQTYGRVTCEAPGERTFVWVHPAERKCLRITVAADEAVLGFNVMGMRLRHRVCERWIAERLDLAAVLAILEEAAFDPELFPKHTAAIRASIVKQRKAPEEQPA